MAFTSGGREVTAVRNVSFDVPRRHTVGLVGESGSGKTVTAFATMGLTAAQGGKILSGSTYLDGVDLAAMSERELRKVRGGRIGMIFQQPIRSLNPAFTVGEQIAETVRTHTDASRRRAWDRAVEMLDRVHIADAAKRAHDYPYTFSGGMCQRAMIAMALACGPELLIADEPTTALDVTVQSKVLALLRELQDEFHLTVLLISHDLAVIADMCEEVVVMYAGEVVERGTVVEVYTRPRHPYTSGLLGSIPRRARRLTSIPGSIPRPEAVIPGCRFSPRCTYAEAGVCDHTIPAMRDVGDGRAARCHFADTLELPGAPTS